MTRRRSKRGNAALGLLVILGAFVWVTSKVVDFVGVIGICIGAVVLLVTIILYRRSRRNTRLAYLRSRYGDEDVVQRIFSRHFWQGQTAAQLTDSLGPPRGVDTNLLATRKREVWKYNPRGTNRFGLRITLDNDVVVSWKQLQ